MRKITLLLFIAYAVTYMTAQNRLVPTSSETGVATDSIPEYPAFVYTVAPSFDPGYVLVCTRKPIEFILVKAESNTWYNPDAKLSTFRMSVQDSVAQIINTLIASAVNTSSYMYQEWGLDGDTYIFQTVHHAAYCWSPGQGRCKDLVTLMDACCRYVETNHEDSLAFLMPQCRALLREFHKGYPKDLFNVERHTSQSYSHQYGERYTITAESFNTQIVWRGSGKDKEKLEKLREEYLKKHEQEFVDYVYKTFIDVLADFPYFDLYSYPRTIIIPDENNKVDFSNPKTIPWEVYRDM